MENWQHEIWLPHLFLAGRCQYRAIWRWISDLVVMCLDRSKLTVMVKWRYAFWWVEYLNDHCHLLQQLIQVEVEVRVGAIGRMTGLWLWTFLLIFSFLFVTLVNELESRNMKVAIVFWSCGKGRKSGATFDWNTMAIGIALVGLTEVWYCVRDCGWLRYNKKFLW